MFNDFCACLVNFFEFPKIIASWKETNWGEPQLLNKLNVDEVGLVLSVPSPKATSDMAPVNAFDKMNNPQDSAFQFLADFVK